MCFHNSLQFYLFTYFFTLIQHHSVNELLTHTVRKTLHCGGLSSVLGVTLLSELVLQVCLSQSFFVT